MNSVFQISIVMLVKNEAKHLGLSLPLIVQQHTDHLYEIIVIDSGSVDGSTALVTEAQRRWPSLRLLQIPPAEFHHSRTRNLGVSLTQGDYVVFLGGDAVPRDQLWLATLVQPLISGAGDGVVATYGRQIPREDADISNICRMTFNYGSSSFIKGKDTPLSSKDRYFFSTVNCCVNKRAVPPPLFDETFPVNEDVTLAARIINSGGKIAYVADAAVVHSHNYLLRDILRRGFDNGVVYDRLGIFRNGDRTVRADGMLYLRKAFKILKGRGVRDWARFLGFFTCTALGVQLGIHHRRLPKFAGRALSKYGTV